MSPEARRIDKGRALRAIAFRRPQGEPEARSGEDKMDKRLTGRNAELGLSTRAIHHGYDRAEEHGALTPRDLHDLDLCVRKRISLKRSTGFPSRKETRAEARRRRPVYWRRAKSTRASGLLKRKSRRSALCGERQTHPLLAARRAIDQQGLSADAASSGREGAAGPPSIARLRASHALASISGRNRIAANTPSTMKTIRTIPWTIANGGSDWVGARS